MLAEKIKLMAVIATMRTEKALMMLLLNSCSISKQRFIIECKSLKVVKNQIGMGMAEL